MLVDDLVELLRTLFPDVSAAPTLLVRLAALCEPRMSLTVAEQLVGHSMGGAVVVRASSRLLDLKFRVTGVAVLDVVEGTFRAFILAFCF